MGIIALYPKMNPEVHFKDQYGFRAIQTLDQGSQFTPKKRLLGSDLISVKPTLVRFSKVISLEVLHQKLQQPLAPIMKNTL